jgi:hypothetical protein
MANSHRVLVRFASANLKSHYRSVLGRLRTQALSNKTNPWCDTIENAMAEQFHIGRNLLSFEGRSRLRERDPKRSPDLIED